jgi:hypothetical protein
MSDVTVRFYCAKTVLPESSVLMKHGSLVNGGLSQAVGHHIQSMFLNVDNPVLHNPLQWLGC